MVTSKSGKSQKGGTKATGKGSTKTTGEVSAGPTGKGGTGTGGAGKGGSGKGGTGQGRSKKVSLKTGPGAAQAVSFANDIKGMFSQRDINCMSGFGVNLDQYSYMGDPSGDGSYSDHANARHVYARVAGTETPRMPKGGPYWTQAQLDLYQQWMQGGFQP